MKHNLLAVSVAVVAPVAQAQAMTPEQALTRLFSASEIKAEWFSPDFLQQAPLTLIQGQLKGVSAQYGKFLRLGTLQSHPQAIYERGSLIVTAAPVDAQGRLTNFGAVPGPVHAANTSGMTTEQQQLGVQVLQKLLSVNPVNISMFSPDFLQDVPAKQLKESFASFRKQFGAFQKVEAASDHWVLQFQRGSVPVTSLNLDAQGLISGLRVGAPTLNFSNFADARAAFAQLPGQTSLLVQEISGSALVGLNADKPLAIGSAFKLAILGELQAQVKAGKLHWTDQITLTDAMKSLPSGTLQDAPAGSRYTLQDLATHMIRDSDNTATDLLLQKVGRPGVEARLGQQAIPSTRELFALKNPANSKLLQAYRAAGTNVNARREVLKQADTAPLPNAALAMAPDVEWFVSTQNLCRLMGDVAALPATQQNPGVASKADFQSVSYKGGSEPGVLNLTTQVKTKAGKSYCISATWNDGKPLNENQFSGLYSGLLRLLK